MNTENTNKKTTCNKKSTTAVFPGAIEVVAGITGDSKSYAIKVINGIRPAKTKRAKKIKNCYEMIVDGHKVLVQAVTEIINKNQ